MLCNPEEVKRRKRRGVHAARFFLRALLESSNFSEAKFADESEAYRAGKIMREMIDMARE